MAVPGTPWVYLTDPTNDLVHLWQVSNTTGNWSDTGYSVGASVFEVPYITPQGCWLSSNASILYVGLLGLEGEDNAPIYVYYVNATNGHLTYSTSGYYDSSVELDTQYLGLADNGITTVVFLTGTLDGTETVLHQLDVYQSPASPSRLAAWNMFPDLPFTGAIYNNSFIYAVVGSSPSYIIWWPILNFASPTQLSLAGIGLSMYSLITIDQSRAMLYLAGQGYQIAYAINTATGNLTLTSSATPVTSASTMCFPVYLPTWNLTYNAINGATLLVYNGTTQVSTSPTTLPTYSGYGQPFPSICGLQVVLNKWLALLSNDRANVTLWTLS